MGQDASTRRFAEALKQLREDWQRTHVPCATCRDKRAATAATRGSQWTHACPLIVAAIQYYLSLKAAKDYAIAIFRDSWERVLATRLAQIGGTVTPQNARASLVRHLLYTALYESAACACDVDWLFGVLHMSWEDAVRANPTWPFEGEAAARNVAERLLERSAPADVWHVLGRHGFPMTASLLQSILRWSSPGMTVHVLGVLACAPPVVRATPVSAELALHCILRCPSVPARELAATLVHEYHMSMALLTAQGPLPLLWFPHEKHDVYVGHVTALFASGFLRPAELPLLRRFVWSWRHGHTIPNSSTKLEEWSAAVRDAGWVRRLPALARFCRARRPT